MYPVYLDNNATTKIAPEVVEAMLPFLTSCYGNPSSSHSVGRKVAGHIEKARRKVADLIGAQHSDEIVFTSCGTESDTSAIFGALAACPDKKHIVISAVEHPAIKEPCSWLARHGYRITVLPVNADGELDPRTLRDAVTPGTAVVSLMWANNETGVIFPVDEISKTLSDRNVIFHTDAVQAAGKISIDVKQTGISMLSLSGHKFHAPKGIGALYIRRGTPFVPLLRGGGQENRKRSGTENVASIVGMGKAAQLAAEGLDSHATAIRSLRDRMEARIIDTIPGSKINGRNARRLINTSNISFDGTNGSEIVRELDRLGICVSSGAACHSGAAQPSPVLSAMGISFMESQGSIRISLSRYTTEKEVDVLMEQLPEVVERVRKRKKD